MVDVLYPPHALFLFVPLAFVPAITWWVVPIAVIGYAVWRWRPAPWAWVAMILLLMWPRANAAFLFGNTDMWMAAAVAAGLLWGWPALALTLKPTFLPLAFIGVRTRGWWIALAVLGVVSLAMIPLWIDYLTAMRVANIGLGYSLGSVPLLLVPIVAWLGRRRQTRSVRSRQHIVIRPAALVNSYPRIGILDPMSRSLARVRRSEYSALLGRPRLLGAIRAAEVGRIAGATIIGAELVWIAYAMAVSLPSPTFGFYFHLNVEAGRRLLETGTPYLPFQLAGPYAIGDGAILYPPSAFFLLIPFLWLPPVLWWAIPIAGLAYGLWWHRPPMWAGPSSSLCWRCPRP